MDITNMTDEQKAQILNAETPEELLELARQEGYELTDDELEAIAGGENGERTWILHEHVGS